MKLTSEWIKQPEIPLDPPSVSPPAPEPVPQEPKPVNPPLQPSEPKEAPPIRIPQ